MVFMPTEIMVVNTSSTGSGNISFSVGIPGNLTQYRNDGATGLLLPFQCFGEQLTAAKTQQVRAIGGTGASTLRINVSAWSQTAATFQPRITISGYAYQL
jgi:hypothetical protein